MRRSVPLALLLALLISTPVCAQAIRGHLIDDSSLSPVGGATIMVLIGETRSAQTLTGDDGYFFIALNAWGTYQLEATRIGYETTTSQPFLVERSDTVMVDFRILPEAVLLDPLLVTGHSNQGRNVFYRRMESWDQGIFITPAMVDSIQPRHPAEVLRKQPKIWMTWGWGMNPMTREQGPVPRIRTFLGEGCVSYMIDGRPVRRPRWATGPMWLDWPLNTLDPEAIVAVEIYRHISEVPPEIRSAANEVFNGQAPANVPSITGGERVQQDFIPQTCGIIHFWTRAGW
ncbi:MAG: carboxypeptidase regulatory-like domain-containing protein [Gemmatimonadetes bacterium]|nr:carboxypeptidase regulatory-like domain-containing protein [Gemmatimonadota bacterium]